MNRKSRKKNKNYRKTILQGASLALFIAGKDPHITENKKNCGRYCVASAIVSGLSFGESLRDLEKFDDYEEGDSLKLLKTEFYDFCFVPILDSYLLAKSLKLYKNL